MFLRIPSERTRSPLARNLYRIQIATIILGTGFYALLLLAPGNALARTATALLGVLFNIIVR
jgi:hypothetical protein